MDSVVSTRAIASFSMSPVDLSMELMVVTVLIADFVRSWLCSVCRSVVIDVGSSCMDDVRWFRASVAAVRAASMFDAMRSVRSNL